MVTELKIEKRPGRPCYTCGSTKWFEYQKGGGVNCARCHPPGSDVPVTFFEVCEPEKEQPAEPIRQPEPVQSTPITQPLSDDIEALRVRVAAGVEKLMTAWKEGLKLPKDEDFTAFSDSFFKARDKLEILCRELMARGYEGCLWQHEPYPAAWGSQRGCSAWGEMVCWVCPKKVEQIWEDMPSAGGKVKPSHRGEKTIKFLETLGGLI